MGSETGEMTEQLANGPFILQVPVYVRPDAFWSDFPYQPIPKRMPNYSIIYNLQPFFGEQRPDMYSE